MTTTFSFLIYQPVYDRLKDLAHKRQVSMGSLCNEILKGALPQIDAKMPFFTIKVLDATKQ